MSRIRVHNLSASLDGFVAGPGQSLAEPLGAGGEQLHEWIFATRFGQAMMGRSGGTTGVDDALSVPVVALVGRSGGGFAVEVVRRGGRRELVAVRVGLFDTTGGRVQVEGALHIGDQVVVPSL